MRETILDKLSKLPRAKRASTLIDRIQRAFRNPNNWDRGMWGRINGVTTEGQIITNEEIDECDLQLLREKVLLEISYYSFKVLPRLTSFCLEGACVYLNGPAEKGAKDAIKQAIFELFPARGNADWSEDDEWMTSCDMSIPSFNDYNDTSIRDVRKVLKRAAEIARQAERKKAAQ